MDKHGELSIKQGDLPREIDDRIRIFAVPNFETRAFHDFSVRVHYMEMHLRFLSEFLYIPVGIALSVPHIVLAKLPKFT